MKRAAIIARIERSALSDRAVVQIVTIAKFRRPANPRRCNIHCYHVWRWRGGPHEG